MLVPLFFIYIGLFILINGVQNPIMMHLSRKVGSVQTTMIRNLSLFVTIVPLFFTFPDPLHTLLNNLSGLWVYILLSALFGFVGYAAALEAIRYLPMAVSTSIRAPIFLALSVVLGAVLLHEYLSLPQLILLAAVFAVGIALTYTKSSHDHLDSKDALRGVLFSAAAACGHAAWMFCFTELSRQLDPISATYVGEGPIGIVALLYLFYQSRNEKRAISWPSLKNIAIISSVALLTIVSSIAYANAVLYGPHALAAGLVPATIVVIMAVGYFFYNEPLTRLQVALIFTTVALIGLLKFIS